MNEDKRWKGFVWAFDEQKYIPSVVACKSFDLDLYELQLRRYASELQDDPVKILDERLTGVGVAPTKLGIVGRASVSASNVSVCLSVDEDFSERRIFAQVRTGNPENFDREVNATLWEDEGEWHVHVFLSSEVFKSIKDGVLNKTVTSISIALRSAQTLTDSFNEYGNVKYVNWYLPLDPNGQPIMADCKLELLRITVGDIWPLLKQEEPVRDDEDDLSGKEHEVPLTTADKVMIQQLAIAQSIQGSVEVVKRYALVTLLAIGLMVIAALLK